MKEYNNSNNSLSDIFKKIYTLQENELVTNNLLYTIPIMLFSNTKLFKVQVEDTTSPLFRIEKIDNNCALLRILVRIPASPLNKDSSSLIKTDKFITIDLDNFCAIKCLNPIYLNNTIVVNNYVLYKNKQIIDQDSFEHGTHCFRVVDSNNKDDDPTYQIDIFLTDLTNEYPSKLINNIVFNNPDFVMLKTEFNSSSNILSLKFQAKTNNSVNKNFFDDLIKENLLCFEIKNSNNLTEKFAFLMVIITIKK